MGKQGRTAHRGLRIVATIGLVGAIGAVVPPSLAGAASPMTGAASPMTGAGGQAPGCVLAAPAVVEAARGRLSVSVPACPDESAISGYRVGVLVDGADAPASTRDVVKGTTRTVFTGLAPSHRYRFEVATVAPGGTGVWSAPSAAGFTPFAGSAPAVQRLFSDFQGRAPTAAESSTWRGPLDAGTRTLPQTVVAAVDLPAWGPVRSPVIRLYRAYFLRLPDTGGLAYWTAQRTAGRSLDAISAAFASSAEFKARYGSRTNAAFVTLVYQNVLGRAPDGAGAAYWTGQLNSGKRTRGQVMTGFSESAEHRTRTAALVMVVHLHTAMLRRVPTSAEVATWQPQLAGGTPAALLAEAILSSPSYGDPQLCNGHRELCDRAFDAVSYPTTHNAMTNADEGWLGPNQEHGMTRQLDDGIRAMMLDTHYNGTGNLSAPDAPADVPLLCHGYCKFGWDTLTEGLAKIRAFLDTHPDEVVSIIFETYVSDADTAQAFAESGLLDYAYAHPVGQPWPTLRTLVDAGSRVVVMTDSGGGSYPWYLPVFTEAFDNPYSAKTTADLSCVVGRGSGSSRLFILNNFLTDPVARRPLADAANANPFFLGQAQKCQAERGHLPNFVTVDFYDRGALFDVVDALNGL